MKILPQQVRLVEAGIKTHKKLVGTAIEMIKQYAPDIMHIIEIESLDNITAKLINRNNFKLDELILDEHNVAKIFDSFSSVNEENSESRVISILDNVGTIYNLDNSDTVWNIPISDILLFVKTFVIDDVVYCDINIVYTGELVVEFAKAKFGNGIVSRIQEVMLPNLKYLKMINLPKVGHIISDTCMDLAQTVGMPESPEQTNGVIECMASKFRHVFANIGLCSSIEMNVLDNTTDTRNMCTIDTISSVIHQTTPRSEGNISFVDLCAGDDILMDTFVYGGTKYYNMIGSSSVGRTVLYTAMSEEFYTNLLSNYSDNEYVAGIGIATPFIIKKKKWVDGK